MPLDRLLDALPDHAADLRENLRLVAAEPALAERRRWGCLLACAYAAGEPQTLRAIDGEAPLDGAWRVAAKTAASLIAVNAVYYRAVRSMSTPEYGTLHAKLQMTALGAPPVPKPDFEMMCLAVSSLYGCGACLDAHEKELRSRGTPSSEMQTALRIAAVVHGVARVLAAEAALADRDADDPPG